IMKRTLVLKAVTVGSFWPNELPHIAHCANADAAERATASTASGRRCVVMVSVQIHEREEERPQRCDEVPIDAAHLEPGMARRGEAPPAGEERDDEGPDGRREHVHRMAADEHVERRAVLAAREREPVLDESRPFEALHGEERRPEHGGDAERAGGGRAV